MYRGLYLVSLLVKQDEDAVLRKGLRGVAAARFTFARQDKEEN